MSELRELEKHVDRIRESIEIQRIENERRKEVFYEYVKGFIMCFMMGSIIGIMIYFL